MGQGFSSFQPPAGTVVYDLYAMGSGGGCDQSNQCVGLDTTFQFEAHLWRVVMVHLRGARGTCCGDGGWACVRCGGVCVANESSSGR
jgi:hypothetical protein